MKIPDVPVWIVGALALFGGVWFLTWHRYENDPEDNDWLNPHQPPAMVAMPQIPAHGTCSPMSCNTGFRSRCYPDVLATAREVISEFMDGDD